MHILVKKERLKIRKLTVNFIPRKQKEENKKNSKIQFNIVKFKYTIELSINLIGKKGASLKGKQNW